MEKRYKCRYWTHYVDNCVNQIKPIATILNIVVHKQSDLEKLNTQNTP